MDQDIPAYPRLVAIRGPATGEVFTLRDGEVTIGRDGNNTVPIGDRLLSRRHCSIVQTPDGWVVGDLHSFNGTLVNGAPATDAPLRDGDRLRLGATELLFRTGADAGAGRGSEERVATTRLRLEDAVYLQGPSALSSTRSPLHRVEQDLRALVRIGTIVNRLRDRETCQEELLDAVFAVVPASHGALLLIEAGEVEPRIVSSRTREAGESPGLSHTIIAQALATGEAILSNDLLTDAAFRHAKSVTDSCLRSVLAVPLLFDARVAGLVYLASADPDVAFDEVHLQLVAAVAGVGALALENVSRLEWLQTETRRLKEDLRLSHAMVGESPAIRRVYQLIGKVARSDATVLIRGETGTGKELAARAVHENSGRAERPFVSINCAALTETLLESELFGHERGAFTGAVVTKKGKIEVAHGGTLFLDEVAELSPGLQAKFLRVLQQREFERVGGTRPIKVDIRILSATNRDLKQLVDTGGFRLDLYFRLNVVTLDMPSLRSRMEDLPFLAAYFVDKFARKCSRRINGISPEAQRYLKAYDWPGNVRELENTIERAVVMGNTPYVQPEDLPEALLDTVSTSADAPSARFHEAVADAKRRIILDAVEQAEGRLTDAARLLGLHPNYLHRLLTNLNLRPRLPDRRSATDPDL
jgi:Nif-specific regulatory protein